MWGGKKGFLAALDQAHGNLTWRDSKAAILTLVGNELTSVLETIEAAVPEHICFVKAKGRREAGWIGAGH